MVDQHAVRAEGNGGLGAAEAAIEFDLGAGIGHAPQPLAVGVAGQHQIGQGANYATEFHDILTGNNQFYPAVSKYDLSTGWGSFIASTLHPARQHGLDHAKEVYRIADRRLGSGWALGRYSIADIHLFRLYWRFVDTLHPPASDYPNLSAHYDRMMARPAVQRTLEAEAAVGYNWTQGPAAPRP